MAATTHRGRRALHAAGLLGVLGADEHRLPASAARVAYGRFDSLEVRRTVSYAVATPPGFVDGTAVPVVYALHGRGEDDTFAVERIRFQDALAAEGVRAVVVAADGGASSYWHPRRDGTDPLSMVVRELVPLVESTFGDGGGRRGLLGWSMGGYGALLMAERFPDLFPVVCAAAPALWRRADEAAPGAFDGPLDFRAHDVFTATERLDAVQVRLDCGRDDPFVDAVEAFAAEVPGAVLGVRNGFHDAATWRAMARDQAAFFGRHLA